MGAEEVKQDRRIIFVGIILIPLVMSLGTALLLYPMVTANRARITLNEKSVDEVKAQATRVEEEQKKRTSNVAKVLDLEQRVKQLEAELLRRRR